MENKFTTKGPRSESEESAQPVGSSRSGGYEWDVFISHASEDKTAIARPLADSLRTRGLRVWYDEFTLSVGDSLRQKIDHGLAISRYGIVILSPHFFAKHWPQAELNGLATREVSHEKVILPVWYGVGFEDVRQYSPPLADRIAVSADKGLENVIESLLKVLIIPSKASASSGMDTSEYIRNLEALVLTHKDQLASALGELERSYDLTLEVLGESLDLKTRGTEGRCKRVTAYTMFTASRMGIPKAQIEVIARGAFLHDIGKIAVPDRILDKQGPLVASEEALLRQHCEKGYLLLKRIPVLREPAEIVYAHEEHFDGTGYPRGLKGKEIPLGARIVSVADALDTMTSTDHKSFSFTRESILKLSGSRFDPEVVDIFADMPQEIFEYLRKEINSQIQSA